MKSDDMISTEVEMVRIPAFCGLGTTDGISCPDDLIAGRA